MTSIPICSKTVGSDKVVERSQFLVVDTHIGTSTTEGNRLKEEKYVFAIVVSGYSGSDLVARQILGAMSMNKGAILPPQFCLMQTANDPGSAQKSEGIAGRLDTFAAHIARTLLP